MQSTLKYHALDMQRFWCEMMSFTHAEEKNNSVYTTEETELQKARVELGWWVKEKENNENLTGGCLMGV